MTDFGNTLGASVGAFLVIFVMLLMHGVNIALNWAKSQGFLVAVTALVLIATNTIH